MISVIGNGNSNYQWSKLLPAVKTPVKIYLDKRAHDHETARAIVLRKSANMKIYRLYDYHWVEFKNYLTPYRISTIHYTLYCNCMDLSMELDQIIGFIASAFPCIRLHKWNLTWSSKRDSVFATNDSAISLYLSKSTKLQFAEHMMITTACGYKFTIGDIVSDYSYESRYAVAFHEMLTCI